MALRSLRPDDEVAAQLFLISHKTGLKFAQPVGIDCNKQLDNQIRRSKTLVHYLLSNCTCAANAIERTISSYCDSRQTAEASAIRSDGGVAATSHFGDLLAQEYKDHAHNKSHHARNVCRHVPQVPQIATVSFDSYFSAPKKTICSTSPSKSAAPPSSLPNKTSRKTNVGSGRSCYTDCGLIQHQNVPDHLKYPTLPEYGTVTNRIMSPRHPVESRQMVLLLSHTSSKTYRVTEFSVPMSFVPI